jgi:peroxiredoxin
MHTKFIKYNERFPFPEQHVYLRALYMKYIIIPFLVTITIYANGQDEKTTRSWVKNNMDSVYKGTNYVPFEITTLNGEKMTNESCKGKVVLFDFWFEGCAGCREEFGKMNELYDSLKNDPGYVFVAVTFDAPSTLPDFIRKFSIRFPVATIMNETEALRLNFGQGFPSKVILDKAGRVAFTGTLRVADKDDKWEISLHTLLFKMRHLQ